MMAPGSARNNEQRVKERGNLFGVCLLFVKEKRKNTSFKNGKD
jgi:hypothetical protein